MIVGCTAVPRTFVPGHSPRKLFRVGGREEGGEPTEDGETRPRRQVWSLGKENGSVLVWQEREKGEGEVSRWDLAAILDGHDTMVLFGAEFKDRAGASFVVTGSSDGTLCCWSAGLLECVRKTKTPARYGCIVDASLDSETGLLAVLTRRDSPGADFVLLVNLEEGLSLEAVLCNTSSYRVGGIHATESGTRVSYEAGQGATLMASLETLQRFDPRKSESVHAVTPAAELRSLAGGLAASRSGPAQTLPQDPGCVALSPGGSLLLCVSGGRRRLATYEQRNKTERDVVYDKAVDMGEGEGGGRGPCAGAGVWGGGGGGEVVSLLSWFEDGGACLQRVHKVRKSRTAAAEFSVADEVEVERDLRCEAANSTPWILLEDSVLARSFRSGRRLSLELIRIVNPTVESGSLRCEAEEHHFGNLEEAEGAEDIVTVERILRNCLGHTFVHAFGYGDGSISILPWPALGEGSDIRGDHTLSCHAGPVACLEEWSTTGHGNRLSKFLLSGCERGEVKVWDLSSLECVFTLPPLGSGILAFILPERRPNLRWSDCFAALGRDGVLSFVSMKEMRIVRAFLAFSDTMEPISIAWNYKRNYVACLSLSLSNGSGESSAQDFQCTIVDVLSCRTDRHVVGSRALLTFSDFVAMDEKHVAICNKRRTCKSLKYSYSLIEKSHKMSVISSDLHLLLEASAKQPDLQIILCSVMLSMHLYHMDKRVDLEFQRVMNEAIANINKKEGGNQSDFSPNFVRFLPTLVGQDNSYSIWLSRTIDGEGDSVFLPPQLLAHMNLVVLSGLGWANSKSLLTPEQFSKLNTFYGIQVPETITGGFSLDAMYAYIEHIEHTNEHARDAAGVLINSIIMNMENKPSAMGSVRRSLAECRHGTRIWAKHMLILGLMALSFDNECDTNSFVVEELLNAMDQPGIPFHPSLVSLLTRGIASSTGEWNDLVETHFLKLVSGIIRGIHAVNDQVPAELSPRKVEKAKSPFTTLLSRDKLLKLLTLLMQKNIRKFMTVFTEKLNNGEVNSASSILPMVFTSILSLINAHPWSLFGATHQVVSACFACMDPANPAMRKSYLHIGMTIICEMGQKLPFIDLNAASMLICIPAAPVEKNASRRIHVFNAKSADLVQELQFENNRHVTAIALKISPESELLACFTVEDSCIRVWSIKQSWTSAFRMSPRVNLPVKCIQCHFTLDKEGGGGEAEERGMKGLRGYELRWEKDGRSLELKKDGLLLGRVKF